MNTLLLSLLLSLPLPASARAAAPVGENNNPAAWLESVIDRDWVARAADQGSVVVASPSYAMPFDQGCVIHQLYFRNHGGRPSLGDMVAQDLYFAFASGDACASVEPARFFGIEPGNDVFALLDFSRRLKEGPRSGRDRLPDGAFARLSQCFSTEAIGTTRIVRAHSWRPQGSRRDQYQLTLTCAALPDQDVVAIGARDQEAITWKVAALDQVKVDLAPPAEASGR